MSLEAIKDCPGADGTLSEFLRIPRNVENLRERYYRDARRIGLNKADADDGAQAAMLKLCEASDTLPDGSRFAPSHAFYSIRRYMRRSLYRGFTGQRRASKWVAVALCDVERRTGLANVRGERMPDNPAAIVAALETAAARVGRAMGRSAGAVRAMTPDDIRSLAMPDLTGVAEREGGDCPRVVEAMPGAGKPSLRPMPAGEGEWRPCGLEWVEVMPEEGKVSRGREWRRLVG